jgi:hypothetical protein
VLLQLVLWIFSKIQSNNELDKMSRQFQNQLLESGRIKVEQQRRFYNFEIKGAKVFATCNEISRLSRPMQSRFRRLHLPPYTKEQFLDIAVKTIYEIFRLSVASTPLMFSLRVET